MSITTVLLLASTALQLEREEDSLAYKWGQIAGYLIVTVIVLAIVNHFLKKR